MFTASVNYISKVGRIHLGSPLAWGGHISDKENKPIPGRMHNEESYTESILDCLRLGRLRITSLNNVIIRLILATWKVLVNIAD